MTIRILATLAMSAWSMAASAQLLSVPQRGVADVWVKSLKIPLAQEWEWIETYEDRVFFATRLDAKRTGDLVTLWTRVEFKDPQGTPKEPYRSIASYDDWDCKTRRRGTALVIMYRYNNLEDSTPLRATNPMKAWQAVQPNSIGETLLEFACGVQPTQQLAAPADSGPRR